MIFKFAPWCALLLPLAPYSQTYASNLKKIEEILETPLSSKKQEVRVESSLTLPPNQTVTKRIIIEGNTKNITLDLNGAKLTRLNPHDHRRLEIRSKKNQLGLWERPENITIKNGKILGSIGVYGIAKTPQGTWEMIASSRTPEHVANTQKSAPKRVTLQNLTLTPQKEDSSALYISPGVQHLTLKNSQLGGACQNSAIYLDAESSHNLILNNTFHILTINREKIAIDGSGYNLIEGNYFSALTTGGIYLYRNCGEGGAIRHRSPSYNIIRNNTFYYKTYSGKNPAVLIGSRNRSNEDSFCNADKGWQFGSSINNKDLASHNEVYQNIIYNLSPALMIRTQGGTTNERNNSIWDNFQK